MPTRRDLQRLQAAQADVVEAGRRELAAFVAMLPSDPAERAAAVAEFFPALVRSYGDIGAALAAEWFEETAPGMADVTVVLGEQLPLAQLESTAEWATGDAEAMARRLSSALQRYVLQPGRRTIRLSAARSGARWARVPMGKEPCAFCIMLASRGAVYETEATATKGGDEDKYHDDCWCEATPIWLGEDLPEGYDPEALYGLYMTGRSAVGGRSPSTGDVLAKMREIHGHH